MQRRSDGYVTPDGCLSYPSNIFEIQINWYDLKVSLLTEDEILTSKADANIAAICVSMHFRRCSNAESLLPHKLSGIFISYVHLIASKITTPLLKSLNISISSGDAFVTIGFDWQN